MVSVGGGAKQLAMAHTVRGWTFLLPGEDNLNDGCMRPGCTGRLTEADVCNQCGRQYDFVENKGWRYRDTSHSGVRGGGASASLQQVLAQLHAQPQAQLHAQAQAQVQALAPTKW